MGAHHLATVALVVLSYMLNVHLVGEWQQLALRAGDTYYLGYSICDTSHCTAVESTTACLLHCRHAHALSCQA